MATAINADGVIDSNILIDAMNGIVDAVAFLEEQQGTEIQISIVSAMELIAGCRNKTEMTELQRFFQKCTFLPITAAVSRVAFQLMDRSISATGSFCQTLLLRQRL